jgi:hypothetical protein
MRKKIAGAGSWFVSRSGLVGVFASFCIFFQVGLLTQAKAFYSILGVLFAVLFLQLLASFVRAAAKNPLLWLALLLIVLVRIPFYLHADGAMVTSDNACDGLQAVEMRDTHTAPFFLLGVVKHMGTIKYVIVAFLMELIGNHYLAYLLIQTLLFVVVLFTLYDLLKDSLHPPTLFVLLFVTQFAFMETIFDFSLSLRGAPYLEMLFFVLLGAGLIDREFKAKARTLLGYYFLFFSIYIHPLGAVLVGSVGLVFLIYAFIRRRFWTNAFLAAGGLLAGLGHWFYYLLYLPKPTARGGWEQINIIPLKEISFAYILKFGRTLKEIFAGLFNFEFSYLAPFYNRGGGAAIPRFLNQAIILISLAVTIAGIVLAFGRILRLIRRPASLRDADWPYLLAGVLAVLVAAKAFLFYPSHPEPRHNFDLVFLILLCYMIVFSRIGALRVRSFFSWRTAVVFVLAAAATVPHYGTFFKVVRGKDAAYNRIVDFLTLKGVRYLTTDFIVAYPIFFLSGRRIRVTDSLGPFWVLDFYPNLRSEVDAVPADGKAYMFFSERAFNRPWHKDATEIIFRETLKSLTALGISFRTYKLGDYVIVIPRKRN